MQASCLNSQPKSVHEMDHNAKTLQEYSQFAIPMMANCEYSCDVLFWWVEFPQSHALLLTDMPVNL